MKKNATPAHLPHATGAPVSDNLNIQTAGARGPALQGRERHIDNCINADPAYGAGVAQAIARFRQKMSADERKIA